MSLVELKAMKSDIYEDISRLQQNLQVINNEIGLRPQPRTEAEEKIEKKK